MQAGDSELSLIIFVLGVLGLLGYVSLEYKYLYGGLPVLLLFVSVVLLIFWQIGLIVLELVLMGMAVQGAAVMFLVVANEVGL